MSEATHSWRGDQPKCVFDGVEHCHLENTCIPILLWHRDHTRVSIWPMYHLPWRFPWITTGSPPGHMHQQIFHLLADFVARSPTACQGSLLSTSASICVVPLHFSSFSIAFAIMKRALEALVCIYWSCLLVVTREQPLRFVLHISSVSVPTSEAFDRANS